LEDQLLIEEILVEDHIVDQEEKPVAANVFDVASYMSYGKNYDEYQETYMHSFFQYDREVEVLGFQSLEKFSNHPLFDEYDYHLEVLDRDVDNMTNYNQKIHEGIHSIFHEELEPMYDSHAYEGIMEHEDQILDSHDDNVVLKNVIQEEYEQVLDAFDKTCDLQMNYSLINGVEIIEQEYGFLYQLEMQHNC
jgi:hypothetical protein